MTDRGGRDRTADPLIVGTEKPTDSTSDHSQPRFPSRSDWDVIVIGAGPSGSLVSRLLARRGHSVLLIDARGFPRDKVCGGCLSARAVALLQQAGLGNVPADAGAIPLEAIEIHDCGF